MAKIFKLTQTRVPALTVKYAISPSFLSILAFRRATTEPTGISKVTVLAKYANTATHFFVASVMLNPKRIPSLFGFFSGSPTLNITPKISENNR